MDILGVVAYAIVVFVVTLGALNAVERHRGKRTAVVLALALAIFGIAWLS